MYGAQTPAQLMTFLVFIVPWFVTTDDTRRMPRESSSVVTSITGQFSTICAKCSESNGKVLPPKLLPIVGKTFNNNNINEATHLNACKLKAKQQIESFAMLRVSALCENLRHTQRDRQITRFISNLSRSFRLEIARLDREESFKSCFNQKVDEPHRGWIYCPRNIYLTISNILFAMIKFTSWSC